MFSNSLYEFVYSYFNEIFFMFLYITLHRNSLLACLKMILNLKLWVELIEKVNNSDNLRSNSTGHHHQNQYRRSKIRGLSNQEE